MRSIAWPKTISRPPCSTSRPPARAATTRRPTPCSPRSTARDRRQANEEGRMKNPETNIRRRRLLFSAFCLLPSAFPNDLEPRMKHGLNTDCSGAAAPSPGGEGRGEGGTFGQLAHLRPPLPSVSHPCFIRVQSVAAHSPFCLRPSPFCLSPEP